MKKYFNNLIAWLASAVLWVCLVTVSIGLHGLAIMFLWKWFFVPTFNLQPLTILQALGVSLPFMLLTDTCQPLKEESNIWPLVYLFLRPLVYLAAGFVVHLSM